MGLYYRKDVGVLESAQRTTKTIQEVRSRVGQSRNENFVGGIQALWWVNSDKAGFGGKRLGEGGQHSNHKILQSLGIKRKKKKTYGDNSLGPKNYIQGKILY